MYLSKMYLSRVRNYENNINILLLGSKDSVNIAKSQQSDILDYLAVPFNSEMLLKALENAKSRDNFSDLKRAKFDIKKKVYNITYVTKDGSIETVKISKVNGKEVK